MTIDDHLVAVDAYEVLRNRHAAEFAAIIAELRASRTTAIAIKASVGEDEITDIIATAARLTHCTMGDIVGTQRTRRYVAGRQLAMWGLRRWTDMSFPQIAKVFDRDHTTIVHACQRIDAALAAGDMTIRRRCDDLDKAVRDTRSRRAAEAA